MFFVSHATVSETHCSAGPPRSPTDGEQNFIVNGNDDFSSSSSFDLSSSAAPEVGFSLPKFKSKQMHNKVSRPTDRLCKVYLFSDQNGIRSLMRISISNCHPRSRAAESDSWRGFSKASAPHRTRTKALSSGLMLRAALPPSRLITRWDGRHFCRFGSMLFLRARNSS